MQRSQHVKIKTGFILLALVAGLACGAFLISQNMDIRQQAKVGVFDSIDCTKENCGTGIEATGNKYTSPTGAYEITYNPNLWQRTDIPASASRTDKDNAMFSYKQADGLVTAYINATKLTPKEQEVDLETFGNAIATKIPTTLSLKWGEKITYKDMEIVDIGKVQAIKFNYIMTFLEQSVPFSEYLIKGKDHYLEAEIKQLHNPATNAAVATFLNNIVVDPTITAQVKGATTTLDETKLTEMVKPSVVSIIHTYCKNIIVNHDQLILLKPRYSFCDGGSGSGFIVSETGLVGTNGHVVTSYPEADIVSGITIGNPGVVMFISDFIRETLLVQQGLLADEVAGLEITKSIVNDPAQFEGLLISLYKLIDQELLTIETTKENYVVNMGQNPIEFNDKELNVNNIDTFISIQEGQYKATLTGYDFGNMFAKKVVIDKEALKGSDVALLQIENDDNYKFPALDLKTTSSIKEGETITIIGYPGLVSGSDNNMLLDYKTSSTNASITRGIISAIKKDTDGHNLIQTDASIEHGNSGGPAFNSSGEVIGIATYGFSSQGGNYNFLRDIADLQQLAEDKSIVFESPGKIYPNWKSGLDYYWNNRYTQSIQQFSQVASNYPLHPSVNSYIADATEAIKNGKDVDLILGIPKLYVFGGVSVIVIVAIAITLFLVIKRKASPVIMASNSPLPQVPAPVLPPTPLPPSPPVSTAPVATAPLPVSAPLPQPTPQPPVEAAVMPVVSEIAPPSMETQPVPPLNPPVIG